jgi:hypothetical protein
VWESPTTAVIEVDGGEPSGRTRRIVFREEDRDQDRFRAVGVVIASLLADSDPVAPPVPPSAAPPARTTRVQRVAIAWLTAAARIGSGLSPGPVRYGAALHGAYRLSSSPLFVGLGVAFDAAPRGSAGVRATWTTGAIGAGLVVPVPALALAIRPEVDVVLQRLAADLAGAPAATASGARWVDGTAASVELVWPEGSPVAAILGADARFLSGGTAVHVDAGKVGSFPALGYGAFLGLELAFLR